MGTDLYTAVTDDYAKGDNTLNGTIKKVEVKVDGTDSTTPTTSGAD